MSIYPLLPLLKPLRFIFHEKQRPEPPQRLCVEEIPEYRRLNLINSLESSYGASQRHAAWSNWISSRS
jgi:hypothetical protein